MKEIQLGNNQGVVLVDDEDYEELIKFNWTVDKRSTGNYAKRMRLRSEEHPTKKIYMHRQLMGFPNCYVDHRDHNTLNNQKQNLRVCIPTDSNRNRNKQTSYGGKLTLSKYKGVTYNKGTRSWQAQIRMNDRTTRIGGYASEIEAAIAYNEEAKAMFGEFAVLNNIENG